VESRKYRTCGQGCVRPGFVRVQLVTHVLRHKEDDAMTGAATSRRSRQGRTLLPHPSPPAGPCLTRAGGGQSGCVPIVFVMAGT
jgi:hypothetical protein